MGVVYEETMKRTILLTFLILFVFSITGCDKDKAETDGDVITDADVITDVDTIKDADASVPDEDTDIQPDLDTEKPDIDDICAQPIDYSLLPFKDDKGNIHFCREGCDIPTANDPQCLSNLWKEDNEYFCKNYPEYDCCNYPCDLNNLIPTYKGEGTNYPTLMECDIALNANNPNLWQTGYYTFKNFNFQDGKIGFPMYNVQSTFTRHINSVKAFEYDIKTKKYSVKSLTDASLLAYNKGNFFTYVTTKDSLYSTIVYYSNGVHRTVYPKAVRNIAYTPVITDKWAFANIREKEGESVYMKYALIKEYNGNASYENIVWNWITLSEGIANDPNIVDDRLVFYGDGFKGYICELDKEPKSLDECKVINRTIDGKMEELRYAWMDSENKNLIYFSPVEMRDGFMRLDTSKEPWEYKKFTVQNLMEDTYDVAVTFVKGNLLSYINISWPDGDRDKQKNNLCMYRLDQEKSYCSPIEERTTAAYTEFDEHYIAWQLPGNPELHLRDMECYCDLHPEVCPYDDYTPNTECPKNIKTGKHECTDADNESPDEDAE